MSTTERQLFVRSVLDLYLGLPHSAARRPSPADRRLAGQLFDRAVPFDRIHAAFMLATLRRVNRPLDATPLPPVRSLHYFIPVLTELLASPLDSAYVQYLHDRFHAIAHRPDGHSATVSDGR